MKRKVVLHGPSTLTISLPTEWAKKHRIAKGDEVEVEERMHDLRVSPYREGQAKSISIDVRNLSREMIQSIIAVLHKSGYDEVRIAFEDPQVVTAVQDRIREMLMGYELVAQSATSCTIRTIASDEAQEFGQVFRRTFLVTLDLAHRTIALLEGNSPDAPAELLALEHTNNRLTNFCHRLLNRGAIMVERAHYAYVISWVFESIADVYKRMVHFHLQHPAFSLTAEVAQLARAVNALLAQLYALCFAYHHRGMSDLREQHHALEANLMSALSRTSGEQAIILMHLCMINQYIYDCFGSVAGFRH